MYTWKENGEEIKRGVQSMHQFIDVKSTKDRIRLICDKQKGQMIVILDIKIYSSIGFLINYCISWIK